MAPATKATTLVGLKLNEISLVDSPANPKARVLLVKRSAVKKEDPTSSDVHVPGTGWAGRVQPADDAMQACRKCGMAVEASDNFCKGCGVEFNKAKWTAAYIDDLPDSSFAVMESGGKKDADGKTTPRELRHLPYKDADGKVDLPHLRNALARLDQSDLSSDLKDRARTKLEAAAAAAGVGDAKKLLGRGRGARILAKALRAAAGQVSVVLKGYMDGEAMTLADALEDRAERQLVCDLWSALDSIFNDDTLTEDQQRLMVGQSFDQFMNALTANDAAGTKEARMTLDLSKASKEIQEHVKKLETELETAKAAQAEAEKKAAAAAPKPEPTPEDVLKGLDPAAKAIVEKAQKDAADAQAASKAATDRVAKMEDERAELASIEKAKTEYGALPGSDAQVLGKLLKRLRTAAPEATAELEGLMKAWNGAIAASPMFLELGSSANGSGAGTAYGQAKAKAEELVKSGKAKTVEQGVVAVFKADPALYEKHRAETDSARRTN